MMQERPTNSLASYRIPKKARSPSPPTNLDRIRVIQTYLKDRTTPEEERRRMERKARYMLQDYEETMGQIRDLRQAAETTTLRSERQAVLEEIDELEQIANNQQHALRGLRGSKDSN